MLVERFACGKQEVFTLVCPERREKQYIRAFLELFESGYAPHVGDVERLAGKRARKLSVTLPNNYADWLFYYYPVHELINNKFHISYEKKCMFCCC